MTNPHHATPSGKIRARGLGVPFDGAPGVNNAITDVGDIAVGYSTIIRGDGPLVVGQGPVRTGVTAILPRGLAGAATPVFAGTFSLNGNGELTGTIWIEESGGCEGPITITNTHSCGVARDATIRWEVDRLGATAQSFGLPVAGETYDGDLNDINGFHVTVEHVLEAIDSAAGGPIEQGSVGGGTGMIAYDFKGGSGSASRVVEVGGEQYTVGAFVQANFGIRRELMVAGAPVGRHVTGNEIRSTPGGSIIAIAATDAPLLPHQCKRLARRIGLGVGRSGSVSHNGSGRYLPGVFDRQRRRARLDARRALRRAAAQRRARPDLRGGRAGDRRGDHRLDGRQRDHGRARRHHRHRPAPRPADRGTRRLQPAGENLIYL